MRVLVAQLGARRHYAIPRILHEAGMLECFVTDLVADAIPSGLLRRVLLRGPFERVRGRHVKGVPADRVVCFPLFGFGRAVRSRLAKKPAERLRAYAAWNREFCRLVARRGIGEASGVYVFSSAGLEILEHARAKSRRTLLDQITAPWAFEERLLAEERQRWPNWEFEGTTPADWSPLAEREQAEWALADRILCGSDFVRDAIGSLGGPVERCVVVPYGVPADSFRSRLREGHEGPLRVLFVGTIQLRKGVQYILEAARMLGAKTAEFMLVGPQRVSRRATAELESVVQLAGPVPRSRLQPAYDWADVLVAPSLSEGSANVCYEALACGLPVITTPNTGSVVRDGIEGFIVPIRSGKAIAENLGALASNPDLLRQLSRNAIARAGEFTLDRYAGRLIAVLKECGEDSAQSAQARGNP